MTRIPGVWNLLAALALLASGLLPDSRLANGLSYLALGYIAIAIVFRARAGYIRRRPHWTVDSWRRSFKICSVPASALAISLLMVAAVDWRLAITGASRSTHRSVWAIATLIFVVFGAVGLVEAIEKLHHDDPSRPCTWPRWLPLGRGQT